LFVLTGPPGTPAQNTGSSSSAAAVTTTTTTAVANTAVAYASPTNATTAPTTGNATTTSVIETTTNVSAAASTILRNLTVGYLTAAKGKLDNRQGLTISGALTLALKEASILLYCHKTIDIPYKSDLQRAEAILQDVSPQNNVL